MSDHIYFSGSDEIAKMLAPKRETDEYWEYKWVPASGGTFGGALLYRRHRDVAWIAVSQHAIQFPAWGAYSDGQVVYCGSKDHFNEGGLTHWQPCESRPKPPVDEDEAKFEEALREFEEQSSLRAVIGPASRIGRFFFDKALAHARRKM